MRIFTVVIQVELSLEKLSAIAYSAGQFESDVCLAIGDRLIDMKSVLGLCSVGLRPGVAVEVRVSGYDEEEAAHAMKACMLQDAQAV